MGNARWAGMAAAAAAMALAGYAMAQEASGTVTAYRSNALRTYTSDGRAVPGERIRVGELPALPAQIVEARAGGLIGVRGREGTVYLRGIDLEFRLAGAASEICTTVAVAGRGAGTVTAGVSAGGGTSRDCRPASQ